MNKSALLLEKIVYYIGQKCRFRFKFSNRKNNNIKVWIINTKHNGTIFHFYLFESIEIALSNCDIELHNFQYWLYKDNLI